MNPIDQLDKLEKIDAEKATKTITETFETYKYIWETDNLIVAAIIVSLLTLSIFIATKISPFFLRKTKNIKIVSIKNISSKNSVTFTFLSIFLWVTYFITEHFQYASEPYRITAILSSSWVIIHSFTHLRERTLFSVSFSMFIWAFVALYSVKLLDEFVSFSKGLSISVGKIDISLFSILSAYAIFGFLFWLSSKIEFFYGRFVDTSHTLTRAQKVLYKKIAKFSLMGLALIIGFRMLDVDITSIAVISGAIAVGIGFGLQKVFSNLISGIILLVDKSIKPGDVIAVGDTYGIVTNLESRYASIITRDGKKHLIPNETLVTQTVENWSYRDDKIRLVVTIGVSYHSDPKLVQSIILDCATAHPRVLRDPSPVCLFSNFGDSSLDFELRFWISDPINGIGFPQSEIRFAIWEKLKEHDIKIPYPHMEVIVRKEEPSSQ